jgi:hypothetical protein
MDDYSPQLDDPRRSAANMALEIAVAVLIAARDDAPGLDVRQLARQALNEIAALVPAAVNPARRVRWQR